MLKKLIVASALTALCLGVGVETWRPPKPRLIYNPSESAPIGWYTLDVNGPIEAGAFVAAYAPPQARKLADERRYLPANLPLLKTVWAVGGTEICVKDRVVRVPNRPDITALEQDGLGRVLPELSGCFVLKPDEVFLISSDVQTSFDSRYFGPVKLENILGTVRYLGGRKKHEGRICEFGGLGTGKGVEGKIKANSAKALLSHCLHIFFWGAALGRHSAVKQTQTPLIWGIIVALSPGIPHKDTLPHG